jgi:hypothetical protein
MWISCRMNHVRCAQARHVAPGDVWPPKSSISKARIREVRKGRVYPMVRVDCFDVDVLLGGYDAVSCELGGGVDDGLEGLVGLIPTRLRWRENIVDLPVCEQKNGAH